MAFNDNRYDIDWRKLTMWLTPYDWRRPEDLALANAYTFTINRTHTDFVYFRNNVKYRLGITPQVVYLEKLLNDRFDIVLRRIRIVKGIAYAAVPLFMKEELKPVKMSLKSEALPVVFYRKEETEMFTVDFIVKIPILVPFDEKELRAYLDNDVLPSKVYKIQIV